jgi:DNA repair protein RecO (recombination protein O)
MTTLMENQPAWLLHSRPFRETSLLLDFFTQDHGRVSAIARGARDPKSRYRPLLQPFIPLQISLVGRSELLNLRSIEASGPALRLCGPHMFSALYVNELMVRLLAGHESDKTLYGHYEAVLHALSSGLEIEPVLRRFELQLLENLGYGLQLTHDALNGELMLHDAWYYLQTDSGFVRQMQVQAVDSASSIANLYSGQVLLDMSRADFTKANTLKIAKRLLRLVLEHHLGDRPLASRELFKSLLQTTST